MSEHVKYLLVGGGMACYNAAVLLRDLDPESTITLVSEEPYPPYNRPPLSKYFITGEKNRDSVLFEPASFYGERKIDLRLNCRAKALDPEGKTVTLDDGEDLTFDKALLATGGTPVRLTLPGNDLEGVFYLRNLDDAQAILEAAGTSQRAAVVGAGFIGMELAATLTRKGLEVTVVETAPHVFPRFVDRSLAGYIQSACARKGIGFCLGDSVESINGLDRVELIKTAAGKIVPCDLLCVGIGIRPNVKLAEEAGLDVDNGIVVNDHLQTSHPDIYAAGDVCNYPDPVFNRRRRVEHWGHAEYGGQLTALNMSGQDQTYDMLSYVWTNLFDLHIEFSGDESGFDRVIHRGSFNQPAFTVLFLKENRLMAYFAVNTDESEYPALQKLIKKQTPLYGLQGQLEDPDFDLNKLK